MKKLTGLEQEFYTEKWNKISNLKIEINIQIYHFPNRYYIHFTGMGSQQTSQSQKRALQKKAWKTLLQYSEKFLVQCTRTYIHTHTHVDVHTQFYII